MAADTSTFSDPVAWVNLGTAGMFLFAFLTGRIYSQTTLSKLESERDKAVTSAEVREKRLTDERNRALNERDEMVEVIKDFTMTASALLPVLRDAQAWQREVRRSPTKRERAGD